MRSLLLAAIVLAACSESGTTTVDAGPTFAPPTDAGRLAEEGPITNDRAIFSGAALSGTLVVRALDAVSGRPIAGARVILGTDLAGAATTSEGGLASLAATGAPTITVTALCHAPCTFVGVVAASVAAYLDPSRDVACKGDPQVYPPLAIASGTVLGRLVLPSSLPSPVRATERLATYVLEASASPSAPFALPPASAAVRGTDFTLDVAPGNVTLYVLVGIEDRSTSSFVPYAIGVQRGIAVRPATRVQDVTLMVDAPIDRVLAVNAAASFTATAAITLGSAGYAVLPGIGSTLPVPALERSLAGESYVVVASTGRSFLAPTTATALALDAFLAPPVITEPADGVWGGTRVAFSAPAADLALVTVSAGTVTWSIVAPGGTSAIDLPHIVLPSGPVRVDVQIARIPNLAYGALRYGDLDPRRWAAWVTTSRDGIH